MNATKTKSMIISTKKVKPLHPQLFLSSNAVEEVTVSHDHVGLTLTNNLSWRPHIWKIHQKASKSLNLLKSTNLLFDQ